MEARSGGGQWLGKEDVRSKIKERSNESESDMRTLWRTPQNNASTQPSPRRD